MSLSYRKARTSPAQPGRAVPQRPDGTTRGTAYRMAGTGTGTGRSFKTDSVSSPAGMETVTSESAVGPATVGTSALQPEVGRAPVGQEPSLASEGAGRERRDNVVELFPGASSAPKGTGNWWNRLRYAEAGMATAEYAIATLAAVGFAGLLVVILRSDEVRGFLMSLIQQALTLG